LVKETSAATILKQMWPKRATYYTYKEGKLELPPAATSKLMDVDLI
jgi:hypothetical protein